MRKAFCLTLLLAVLAVGSLVGGFGAVNAARDQVTLTETTRYGDKAAAGGLRLRVAATLDETLVWDTTHTVGASPADTTAYRYYDLGYEYPWDGPDYRVSLETQLEYGLSYDLEAEAQYGLNRAYKELYDATAPGEEGSMEVRVADYLDDYPLAVMLESPEDWFSMSEAEYLGNLLAGEPLPTEPDSWDGLFLSFREFFRIPVLEEETLSISLGKNTDGQVAHWGSGSTESDSFYLNTFDYNAAVEGGIWFTFDAHTQQGALVDTSQIPGGYGIYRLPCLTWEQAQAQNRNMLFLAEELEMVYPLDPRIELISLTADPAGQTVRLLAAEGDRLTLTVIDPARCRMRQRIEIADWPLEGYSVELYDGGDFLALQLPDSRIAVITIRQDGTYVLEFVTPVPDTTRQELVVKYHYAFGRNGSMDFDGQTLAALFPANGYFGESCDLCLMLYDASGLVYLGDYASSLSAPADRYEYREHCLLLQDNPLTVCWGPG